MAFVFIVAILCSLVVSAYSVTCSGEVRSKDLCYYARYCEASSVNHVGASTDSDLNVTCSSALVSWSAPKGSVVNLQYQCFWTENNTKVSQFPVVFEDSSTRVHHNGKVIDFTPRDGEYCIFGGCYQLESDDTLSRQFPNSTCGILHKTDVPTALSSPILTHSSMIATPSKLIMSTRTSLSPQSLSTTATASRTHSSMITSVPPSSVSTWTSISPNLQSTNILSTATGCIENPLFVVSIVLITVAAAFIAIALVLFCYTFYFWKRISQARTAVDKEGTNQPLTDKL